MFCTTFLLVGFVHNTASSSAEWSEQAAVSARWLFGIVPKGDAASPLLTEVLVKTAVSFLKEKPRVTGRMDRGREKQRGLCSVPLCWGWMGHNPEAFGTFLSGTAGRDTLCRSSVPLWISSQYSSATEAQSILCLNQWAPDPNQTPESGTAVLALQAGCVSDAVPPQQRTKQQKRG